MTPAVALPFCSYPVMLAPMQAWMQPNIVFVRCYAGGSDDRLNGRNVTIVLFSLHSCHYPRDFLLLKIRQ